MLKLLSPIEGAGSDSAEQEDRLGPLLQEDGHHQEMHHRPSIQMSNAPSYTSFYDFFPPDLSQFRVDKSQNDTYRTFCMTSAWRVVSYFIVIFVLPTILISVPLYARYHLYKAQKLSSTDGDMLSLHNGVSTFWCQGQKVTSNGTFEAYLTPKPRRLKRKHRTSHLSSEILLTQDDIEEWGVYLIKGSRFSFSSCARWPGGTLLVVQGEENLKRCFYREERVVSDLTGNPQNKGLLNLPTETTVQTLYKPKELVTETADEVGGEVFDEQSGNEISSKNDLIEKLYFPERANRTDVISTQDIDDLRRLKEKKSYNKKASNFAVKVNQTEPSLPESSNPKFFIPQQENEEFLAVHKGSFFFNLNDTLDVTAGNSSFSSSEEFMRQCTDTIVSIELTPFAECKDIASVNDTDSPNYWSFVSNKTDFYYFIFTSDNSIEANVISFRLLIERILYNISEPLEKCSSESECQFSFPFMKAAGVIVDFSTYANVSKLEDLHTYEITSTCQPRTVVYTVFILMVPFIIILFAFR